MAELVHPRIFVSEGSYLGLHHFVEEEAEFSFGRDAERKMIIGNLRASRLTPLNTRSAVRKSSVLRAGMAVRLHQHAERNSQHQEQVRDQAQDG
jgi:hypothetical protein